MSQDTAKHSLLENPRLGSFSEALESPEDGVLGWDRPALGDAVSEGGSGQTPRPLTRGWRIWKSLDPKRFEQGLRDCFPSLLPVRLTAGFLSTGTAITT